MKVNANDAYEYYKNAFYEARDAGNHDKMLTAMSEMVRIAKEECQKSDMNPTMHRYYINETNIVRDIIKSMMQSGGASVGMGEFERKPHRWFRNDVPNHKLKDIKGLQNVVDEFAINVMAPFDEEKKLIYNKYRGDDMSLQLLLYGPPGTGKTFLAKCLAGQLNCHIAVVQSKDILAGIVSYAEKNIAEVFEQAEEYERCIIFIDEIDALAASRESDDSKYTKGVLTTMLEAMDGFTKNNDKNKLRIIIAATNRPWILDSAVRRGGRFETQIYVPPPDKVAIKSFVEMAFGKNTNPTHINIPFANDVTVDWLADQFADYAGADILAMCKQIINRPLRRELIAHQTKKPVKDPWVTQADFAYIKQRYINVITPEMREQFEKYRNGYQITEKPKSGNDIEALLKTLVTVAGARKNE